MVSRNFFEEYTKTEWNALSGTDSVGLFYHPEQSYRIPSADGKISNAERRVSECFDFRDSQGKYSAVAWDGEKYNEISSLFTDRSKGLQDIEGKILSAEHIAFDSGRDETPLLKAEKVNNQLMFKRVKLN